MPGSQKESFSERELLRLCTAVRGLEHAVYTFSAWVYMQMNIKIIIFDI